MNGTGVLELSTPIQIPLFKRLFDVVLSSVLLTIALPVFITIAILIKIEGLFNPVSRGPVFYTEVRLSRGQLFLFRKFRIFIVAAYQPILDRGEFVSTKKLERTPGTTTLVGRFLKKFYIDELPQLWNVFMGDMSMVGTRPWTPPDYEKELAKGIIRKQILIAGLTGPVQIHKRDAVRFGGEHVLDNFYINLMRTESALLILLYDIKILVLSVFFVLRGQGL
ncbi:MAG: sugar transferase [Patescibacteria group bacterium]